MTNLKVLGLALVAIGLNAQASETVYMRCKGINNSVSNSQIVAFDIVSVWNAENTHAEFRFSNEAGLSNYPTVPVIYSGPNLIVAGDGDTLVELATVPQKGQTIRIGQAVGPLKGMGKYVSFQTSCSLQK